MKGVGGYEAHKKQMEEKKKKEAEEEERKRQAVKVEDPEKLKSDRKQFFKKQKEQLVEQFGQMVKQREEVVVK